MSTNRRAHSKPKRGEIWLVDFDPTTGSEIGKRRPAVLVGVDAVGKLPLRIVVPVTNSEQCTGFVLFDDVSGGGGHVLPLVLTGNANQDQTRARIIETILRRAREICQRCECGNGTSAGDDVEGSPMPITREDYASLRKEERSRYRIRQSCYGCLRTYQNQRYHHLLDRRDAARVLKAILVKP